MRRKNREVEGKSGRGGEREGRGEREEGVGGGRNVRGGRGVRGGRVMVLTMNLCCRWLGVEEG